MIKYGVGAALALAAAGAAQAQQPQGQPAQAGAPMTLAQQIQEQAVNAAAGKFVAPACSADKGLHFKVSSGKTYLKSAIEANDAEKRNGILNHADQVLTEAITQNGQDKSAGAWYYKGRVALLRGDLPGADSALTKAEALAPDCKAEIAKLRQLPYVPLFNQGISFMKAGQNDSALTYFRWAARINPTAPEAAYSTAGLYLKLQQSDSAAAYYKRTIELATAPDQAARRNEARYNLGVLYVQAHRGQEAVPYLQAYLKEKPNDVDAKKALAVAYRDAGMADSAKAMESQLVNVASSGGEAAGVSSGDVMAIGINQYKEKKFADAAATFKKVVAGEPYNRGALIYLANSYLQLKDGANLLPAAQRIVELEPMNAYALQLLGQGYKLTKKIDLAGKAAERLLALPVDVDVTAIEPSGSGLTVTATATGRSATTLAGKAIAPAAQTLVFEFLDATGKVVNSQTTSIPALKAGATQTITVAGQGSGIVGFRYHQQKT